MGKQGLMVFCCFCGNMPPHRAAQHLARVKQDLEDAGNPELAENYELMFIPGVTSESERGIEIIMFPYKDYKFNIGDMTPGELENFVQNEILSKLHKP